MTSSEDATSRAPCECQAHSSTSLLYAVELPPLIRARSRRACQEVEPDPELMRFPGPPRNGAEAAACTRTLATATFLEGVAHACPGATPRFTCARGWPSIPSGNHTQLIHKKQLSPRTGRTQVFGERPLQPDCLLCWICHSVFSLSNQQPGSRFPRSKVLSPRPLAASSSSH